MPTRWTYLLLEVSSLALALARFSLLHLTLTPIWQAALDEPRGIRDRRSKLQEVEARTIREPGLPRGSTHGKTRCAWA